MFATHGAGDRVAAKPRPTETDGGRGSGEAASRDWRRNPGGSRLLTSKKEASKQLNSSAMQQCMLTAQHAWWVFFRDMKRLIFNKWDKSLDDIYSISSLLELCQAALEEKVVLQSVHS